MQAISRTTSFTKGMPLALFALCLISFLVPACGPTGETRVARWPLSVFPAAEKKKALATLNKGERIEMIAPGEVFSQVRMVDGQEGFVESKHLFQTASVLMDRDFRLHRRPSASSGEAASGKHLAPGVVIFVKEYEENEEGRWMAVEGGQKGTFFRGWLKEDVAHSSDLGTVQDGLRLDEAVRKEDVETLEELSGRSGAIGDAAAAALVDIEGVDEESEDSAEDSNDSENTSDNDSRESSDDSQDPAPADASADESTTNDKPAPPAMPDNNPDVEIPTTATTPSKPPPPPPSL